MRICPASFSVLAFHDVTFIFMTVIGEKNVLQTTYLQVNSLHLQGHCRVANAGPTGGE